MGSVHWTLVTDRHHQYNIVPLYIYIVTFIVSNPLVEACGVDQ